MAQEVRIAPGVNVTPPPLPPLPQTAQEAPREEAPPQDVTVHMTANARDVEFHFWAGDEFLPICVAPCTRAMPMGTHDVAIRHEHGRYMYFKERVVLDGPTRLDIAYTSRSGLRTAGWLTVAGSAALFVALLVAAPGVEKEYDSNGGYTTRQGAPVFVVGLGLSLLTSAVGIIMAFIPDSAEIRTLRLRTARGGAVSSWGP